MATKHELNGIAALYDVYWVVEARDTKKSEWYQVGPQHKSLVHAVWYRDDIVLHKARHRKARIIERKTWAKQVM